MGGLADLLFFAVLLWFVFRAAGKAAGGMRPPAGEGGEEEARPAPDRAPSRARPDRRPSRARPGAEQESFRERLMEELGRWEAEQRARAGPGEAPAGRAPAESRRTELDPWRDEAEIPRVPVEATEPEIEARSLEVEPPEPVPTERLPRRVRREEGRTPRAPARLVAPERAEVPSPPPAGSAGTTALRRRGPARLPDLSGYTPIQRAVLWGEILGPPPGLRD